MGKRERQRTQGTGLPERGVTESEGRTGLTSIKVGQCLEEEVPLGHLVSVKHTHQLIPWDGILLGVDLVQGIVHVARLAVHLPWCTHTPGHIHHLLAHALTPALTWWVRMVALVAKFAVMHRHDW